MKSISKDKRTNIIIFTYIIVFTIGKFKNLSLDAAIIIPAFIICLGGTIYYLYKPPHIYAAILGDISLIGLLVLLCAFYDKFYIIVPIPALFGIMIILCYIKIIRESTNKNKINYYKSLAKLEIPLAIISQIFMIYTLFH